jgi:hypothetical protein
MTHPNDVPDWRDRLTHRQPTPVPVSASGPSRGLWSSEGVVTSELEADWEVRAGGSRAVLRLSILTYLGSLAVSGQLGALVTSFSAAILPLVVLVAVLVVLVSLLPGGRFVAGALVASGVRGFSGARRRPGLNPPGRQITLAKPAGGVEEVLVASSRRLPAGTTVQAFGPRLLGRRHAWFVRPKGGGLVAARGAVSAVVVAPLLLLLSVVTLVGAVAQ